MSRKSRPSQRRMSPEDCEKVYERWQNRSPPRALGAEYWPQPRQDAFKGTKVIFTGELETITREGAKAVVGEGSGRVMSGMSKNLDYVVAGRDPGPVKMEKAAEMGIPVIGEKQFHEMVNRGANPPRG